MIGNDIVDIEYSRLESNWKRRGFLDKLFTNKEQEVIHNYYDAEVMIWNLWSAKESVYKIVSRKEGRIFYTPKQFEIFPDELPVDGFFSSGSVAHGENTFFYETIFEKGCIHTIAFEKEKNYHSSFHSIGKDQSPSLFVRKKLLEKMAEYIPEQKELRILKNHLGIPFLQFNVDEKLDLSISHHGRFVGYAFPGM